MGFCYFNTIAITAKQLLLHTDTRKILIIDWAIHHGNGVQKMFYNDPRVLYISIHRFSYKGFYSPGCFIETKILDDFKLLGNFLADNRPLKEKIENVYNK